MNTAEFEYYQCRAEAQIALAQTASDSRVVQAHYQLASAYLDRIYGDPELSETAAAG